MCRLLGHRARSSQSHNERLKKGREALGAHSRLERMKYRGSDASPREVQMRVLVLGGSGRFGSLTACRLAASDIVSEVGLAGRNQDALARVASEVGKKARVVQVDILDEPPPCLHGGGLRHCCEHCEPRVGGPPPGSSCDNRSGHTLLRHRGMGTNDEAVA